ncbi:hypothetical protein GON01_07595 [Sphingomonas sp. MAH-20]|mgnify:CR=1 FL=1|jgi:hypothetical protein|uniref:Uncharacterized protein n=1 Tax=Sphingomonas horti TaxID=2682842 RepID=A0A6I4J044_9SPHN|nr:MULTISPECIES: hypothetical protein [Sphingomonas]MBA2919914.1 hypothetical protein [Sphingomonas sp. CGMCC 1.13658]MVO77797.1 hypothetical protein [Sphingomonas horti]
MKLALAMVLPVLAAAVFLSLGLLEEAVGVGLGCAVVSLLLAMTDRPLRP